MPGPIPGPIFQWRCVNAEYRFGPGRVHEYVYLFIFMSKLEGGRDTFTLFF